MEDVGLAGDFSLAIATSFPKAIVVATDEARRPSHPSPTSGETQMIAKRAELSGHL